MEEQSRNAQVEKLIDEQLRQMSQVVKSKDMRQHQPKPNNIWGKIKLWWHQNIMLEKYDM